MEKQPYDCGTNLTKTSVRIDLVFPKLPPALDGIGDHTAHLAEALAAAGAQVRVLTAQPDARPVSGVVVERAFSMERRRGIRQLAQAVREDPPDWLFVQFNQFSYGRWGLNPWLPLTLRRIKRTIPQTRIAWMAHEDFMPAKSLKFAVMSLWQRWQFRSLGHTADLIFFPIEHWTEKYQTWFPDTPVRHLPVGSNIPYVGASRREARRRLGINRETFVAGLFGSARGTRTLSSIRRAAEALHRRTEDFMFLYVGRHGSIMQEAMGSLPLRDAGPLPAEEVSVHLSAMDLHLTPFAGGVSARRGSFMAGLQHGIATVATEGPMTDALLQRNNGEAFVLAPAGNEAAFVRGALDLYEDAERRMRVTTDGSGDVLGREGRRLYESTFDWPHLAERLLAEISQRKVEARNIHPNRARKSQTLPSQTS